MNLEEFAGYAARQFAGASIGFSAPGLSQFINPDLLKMPSMNADPFSLSLTRGAYGQSLMKQGNTSQGLSFMQSSASMGDAGLLSQLSLGSAYANGSYGLPKDAGLARRSHYSRCRGKTQASQNNCLAPFPPRRMRSASHSAPFYKEAAIKVSANACSHPCFCGICRPCI
jgi:hypothetical protein